ncbi:FAD binding domain-containing protein [Halorientalis marina]|jgi:carbon-monoxide dehydrogenase medium subunit|uniref:FAD binding domain-containing protein n=1 Tax=Halorientalis marina TaxID=2931976 RepID=UPI001FF19045|nr:xanthine dehydrogenase family protein subunit M [Halorientalis marina]
MYPGEFDYLRAESVEHALDLLDEHPDAELLAGGHSLLPTMKSGLADPDTVVDIGHIESMQGIEHDGDTTSIGALTTYAEIDDTDELWDGATALAEAASEIGDTQVRNRGTIGGNLAHSDPASDLPGAAIASDLTLVAEGRDGERRIDADDFFVAMYMTDLAEDELLTRVEVPRVDGDAGGAYVKKPSPSSGYALVGVAARLHLDDGTVTDARVGANGVMDHGVRLDPVEDALEGERLNEDAIAAAAEHAAADLDESMMMDDIQASAEYRAHLLEVYTERALERAAERAGATVPA